MIAAGLVNEVEDVLERGYDINLKPLQSLGYKQIIKYLSGGLMLDEATHLINRDTWHYAKRQMTWFGGDSEIEWFAPSDIDAMRRKIDQFLSP